MTNLRQKVTHALTYMEGSEVYEWKQDVEVWILSNPAPSDPQVTVYDNFEFAFIESWTDTNEPYRAAAELDQLRMEDNDVDTYITVFTELAHKALYHEDDPAVLEKFKAGLPLELLELCMHHDDPRNWEAWTRSTRKHQAILTSIKTHRPMLRLFLPLPFHMPILDCLLQTPICIPVSSTTSPSLPLSHFSSSSLADVDFPSPLSRTLTHYAYLLIFLSPMPCTILRPVVAGPSQAFLVFNLS